MTKRIRQSLGAWGAAAFVLSASAPAKAQYPAYGQTYSPPGQQAPVAYRPGQTGTIPTATTSGAYNSSYASRMPAGNVAPRRAGANMAPAFQPTTQPSAGPQYRVAANPSPAAPSPDQVVPDRYAGPYGQTNAPPEQPTAATNGAAAEVSPMDRYAAAYTPPSAAQAPPSGAQPPADSSAPATASPRYASAASPQYTAMAYRNNNLSFQAGDVEADPPAVNVPAPPDQLAEAEDAAAAIDEDSYASPSWQSTAPAEDCNCQAGTAGVAAAPGGNCNFGYGANSFNYSTYDCSYGSGAHGKHGVAADCVVDDCPRPPSRWFGGAYGLLMDRSGGPSVDLAFASAGLAAGDFPASSDVVLGTGDVDLGYQGGIEFRLGRTLGAGAVGLEGVYWTLFSHDQYAQYIDGAASRTYSMIDLNGLEFDPDGAGALPYRPVSHYWDSAPPVGDSTAGGAFDDIEVRIARARNQFEVHNIEINLLQVVGLAGGAAGSCDTGVYAANGCGGSRFTCGKFAGFRFLRLDESFMYGVDFENTVTNATGFLNHNIRAENDLYGFQLGCNNTYRLGSRWGLHCNAMLGLYGNDIDVRQTMDSPVGGDVRFASTTDPFAVAANESEVSTVGELRVGASYQYGVNCRIFGGWRLLGVTGVALAADQLHSAYIDPLQASRIQSDGSILLHGMQAGVEFGY